MTWLLITAVILLAAFLLVWAALVAAARADAGDWEPPPPPRPTAVVVDVDPLVERLDAAVVLLRAHRIALRVPAAGGHEVAAAGAAQPQPAREASAVVEEHALLVASRRGDDEPFAAADVRLLDALARTFGDVVSVAYEGEPPRTGRFDRSRARVVELPAAR